MVKKLVKILCVILAVTMVFTLASCKKTKVPEKNPVSNNNNNNASAEENNFSNNDGEIADIWGEQDFVDEEYIVLPETAYSTKSSYGEEDSWGDEFDDLGDLDDVMGPTRLTATSLIQKEGNPVKGKNRQFNIDVKKVAYPDFRGLGSNVFPCNLVSEAYTTMTAQKWDFDEVNFEIDAKRWKSVKPHYNRMWFDVHWFTTSEEKDYRRKDIENNKDYQNYINGIYDYDSEYMQSVYKYLQVWQDAGAVTALNYSWKVGERIQEWFAFPGVANPKNSAPYDLDAYARSCVDLLQYLREEKGFTSVECLTFYNEPHYEADFDAFVYEPAYWVAMVKRVEKELVKRGIRDDIEIWATEHGSIQNTPEGFSEYVRDNAFDTVDMWAFHSYYSSNKEMIENNYSYWYHYWAYTLEKYRKKIYVTETYASSPTYGNDFSQKHSWKKWTDSRGSQIVCAANVGLYGVLDWGMAGGYLAKPIGSTVTGNETAAWGMNYNDESLDKVQHNFFDESLITNYIPAHSDVLMVDWTGDDIHGSAFKLPNGGYTILIDAKGNIDFLTGSEYEVKGMTERNITFNLKGLAKDVKFYKYSYIPDKQKLNHHATINQHDYIVTTKKGVFKDTISKEYGMYIYTTMPPVKQIEIAGDSILHKIEVDAGTYNFDAKTIDCKGDIVWSISAATDGNRNSKMNKCGSINSEGVYTLDEDVSVGDKIAIRASLKSDPTVYDVVMVRIVDNN